MKVVEGNENRTIFFGMDQWRDELIYSNVKGKNPFKDQRVRQAGAARDRRERHQDAGDAGTSRSRPR